MSRVPPAHGARHAAMVLLAVAAALAPAAPHAAGAPRRSVVFPTRTMGTYANVIVVTADSAAAAPAARRAQAALARVDSLMSNWTTTSEVARINRVAGHESTAVDSEVAIVIDRSLELWRESDLTFDITVEPLVRAWGFLGGPRRVPTDSEAVAAFRRVGAGQVHWNRASRTIRFDNDGVRIDLGGIAKGYAVDVAADALRAAGVTDALVDLTGNMFAIGTPADSDHWRIGIRDPRDRMPYFARLSLRPGEGISTSGKYEQFVAKDGRTYGHILDPRTGRPADGLISVTVVSRSAFTCDAWDTPLFVLGPAAARAKAASRSDFAAVLVQPGTAGVDTVWVESTLADRFTLEPEARARFAVVVF
jgi:thiamine biosynthesis lipoprotein